MEPSLNRPSRWYAKPVIEKWREGDMSHVTTGEMCITNLDYAEIAAKRLGGKLIRDQKTFEWYGEWLNDWSGARAAVSRGIDPATFGQCDHAIVMSDAVKGDYEIGLVKRADGKGFDAVYDLWGRGEKLEKEFGVGLCDLKTEIGVVTSMKTYGRMGYQVKETKNKQGQRQVVIWK
jgi:hypothetical protein|tara:strand:+ start:10017 stop:10544 length:528 start_codon:yes stop_codon:yes gene_type:complete